jgi:hypothetical protein
VSLIACMDSSISCESSGPRIESMMAGSSLVEGATGGSVSVERAWEFVAAHSNSSFVRLSIMMEELTVD